MMSEGSTIVNLTQREGGDDSELEDLSGKVHQLPCAIRYDGPCSVSDFFKPRSTGIEVEGLKVEEAYFRGRKLQGTTIPLSTGYCGYDGSSSWHLFVRDPLCSSMSVPGYALEVFAQGIDQYM